MFSLISKHLVEEEHPNWVLQSWLSGKRKKTFVLAHLFWREAFTIYLHETLGFSLGSLVKHCSVLNTILYVPGYGNFRRKSSMKQLYSTTSSSTDASCATQARICPCLGGCYCDSAWFEFAKQMKLLINIHFLPLNTLCQLSDFILVVFIKGFLHQEASLIQHQCCT